MSSCIRCVGGCNERIKYGENKIPDPANLANKTTLTTFHTNDVVMAVVFPIVVLHTSGGNGTFPGDGFVTFLFIEKFKKQIGGSIDANSKDNVGIRITFNNIGVNTDFKFIFGEIIASYDSNWGSIVDGDKLIEDGNKLIEELFGSQSGKKNC